MTNKNFVTQQHIENQRDNASAFCGFMVGFAITNIAWCIGLFLHALQIGGCFS
jgi:hypothetical protein